MPALKCIVSVASGQVRCVVSILPICTVLRRLPYICVMGAGAYALGDWGYPGPGSEGSCSVLHRKAGHHVGVHDNHTWKDGAEQSTATTALPDARILVQGELDTLRVELQSSATKRAQKHDRMVSFCVIAALIWPALGNTADTPQIPNLSHSNSCRIVRL